MMGPHLIVSGRLVDAAAAVAGAERSADGVRIPLPAPDEVAITLDAGGGSLVSVRTLPDGSYQLRMPRMTAGLLALWGALARLPACCTHEGGEAVWAFPAGVSATLVDGKWGRVLVSS